MALLAGQKSGNSEVRRHPVLVILWKVGTPANTAIYLKAPRNFPIVLNEHARLVLRVAAQLPVALSQGVRVSSHKIRQAASRDGVYAALGTRIAACAVDYVVAP